MLKRITAILLSMMILLVNIRVEVYATGDSLVVNPNEERLGKWLFEFAKANNMIAVSQRINNELQAQQPDLTLAERMEVAGNVVGNIVMYPDDCVQTILGKFREQTDVVKDKIYGLFKDSGGLNISINNDLALELKLDLFSKSIANNFNITLNNIDFSAPKEIFQTGDYPNWRIFSVTKDEILDSAADGSFYPYVNYYQSAYDSLYATVGSGSFSSIVNSYVNRVQADMKPLDLFLRNLV